jgi:hemoglobin
MTSVPTPTPYELIGGDAAIRQLVDRFYDLMDSAPEAANVRRLHAATLKASRDKLHLYLLAWTGGPQTYIERNGHPRLRARHLPFRIGSRERDEWVWCMDRALDEQPMPSELREDLRAKIHNIADHMRNQIE